MSIIYKALEKTQRNLIHKRDNYRERPWLDMVLYAIIICLLLVVGFAYYPKIKKYFHKPIVVQKTIVAAPVAVAIKNAVPTEIAYQGKLILNGVFMSDQEKIALINNQPMHVGDSVEGKKIISIDLNKVKLQDQSNILILKAIS